MCVFWASCERLHTAVHKTEPLLARLRPRPASCLRVSPFFFFLHFQRNENAFFQVLA